MFVYVSSNLLSLSEKFPISALRHAHRVECLFTGFLSPSRKMKKKSRERKYTLVLVA